MRILHVYKTSEADTLGGIETFIRQLAIGCSKQGAHVDVLCLSKNPIPRIVEKNGYTIYRAKQDFQIMSMSVSLEAFSLYRRLAMKADVIHYHFPWPFMDLLRFTFNPAKPCIVTYHSDIERQK